jgi:hypothetical protein
MLALWIVLSALAYCFMGGLVGGRYQAVESGKCAQSEHFGYNWCGHSLFTIWFAAPLWPVFLPASLGLKAGMTTPEDRASRRHKREIAEAKHKAELAKLERQETEELNRQLEAAKR